VLALTAGVTTDATGVVADAMADGATATGATTFVVADARGGGVVTWASGDADVAVAVGATLNR
jgi:hypothetical protein